jgi:hypothetical protein
MTLPLHLTQQTEDIHYVSSLGFVEVSAVSLSDLYLTPFLEHHV